MKLVFWSDLKSFWLILRQFRRVFSQLGEQAQIMLEVFYISHLAWELPEIPSEVLEGVKGQQTFRLLCFACCH